MSVFIGYPSFMAYQMMKGKKGNNDGFPSIPGIVARYSASGLTNEQMKENPVWVDKTGNGHDLQMKNFAWSGMSGVGGYVQDFNYFRNNATVDKVRIDEQNSNSIKVTILTTGIYNAIYIPKNVYQFNKPYFIKISSEGYNEGDPSWLFYAPSTSTATTVKVPLNPNGITEIPAIKEDDFLAVYLNVGGKVGSFTVEQLPIYPGALVFDGVDDYGTCDNFPIPIKEKGYTVVALRKWLTPEDKTNNEVLVANLTGEVWNAPNLGAFGCEIKYNNSDPKVVKALSFGRESKININENDLLFYQTSNSYNGVNLASGIGNGLGGSFLTVGSGGKISLRANAAIWELIILDHDATEEELTKIKNYFVKTYPGLFPDQAWTVTGKTNEDEDRATIANITGNGNDLVLSNFGFAEGSGYNEEGQYAGYLVTDGVDDRITSSGFQMGKDFTIVGDWKFIGNKLSGTGLVKLSSFYIYNTIIGLDLYINSWSVTNSFDGIKSINAACSDGRAYDRNWNEILANTGNVVGSGGILEVSSSRGRFDRIAFKNLAIYPRILSKEDCIKAYNYLQTLKAK